MRHSDHHEPLRDGPVAGPVSPRLRSILFVGIRANTYRIRALFLLVAFALLLSAWWLSGFLFAYTDDAYLTSDIVTIKPEVSGAIEAISIQDNAWVERGSILFTIDATPFRLALDQSRAEEQRSLAQLSVDQAELESRQADDLILIESAQQAQSELVRKSKLAQSGQLSSQELARFRTEWKKSAARQQKSRAALEKARDVLRADEAAIAVARAASHLAQWRLDRTIVRASTSGYITHLAVRAGDMAEAGSPLLAIVDTSSLRVVADYKEHYLPHLRPGHAAWIWLDGHPWHLYRARIQGIAHGFSREREERALVPYVSPTVNWIRLQRRVPVRFTLLEKPAIDQLYMGTDARVLVIY